MSAVSKTEDEVEDGAVAGAKTPFMARLKAWWNGVDLQSPAEEPGNDEAPSEADPEAQSKSGDNTSKLSFWARLGAWWHGVESAEPTVSDESGDGEVASAKSSAAGEDDIGPKVAKVKYDRPEQWTNQRLTIIEKVWGDGMLSPGGSVFVLRLANPFGLDQSKHLLEIGPGLGGAARTIAGEFNTYVTGFEPNPILAATAQTRSNDKGMGKRAVIEPYSVAALDKCKTRFDAMFSKDALYLIEDKPALFKRLPKLLKPRGEIIFTDYVLADAKSKAPALEAWRDGEPSAPYPWRWEQYDTICKKNGLDIRVHEDLTKEYCAFIVEAWRVFQSTLTPEIKPEDARLVMDEIALWQRRREALESGALRVLRVHLFVP